jgi:uncharacterized lipoprotein YmbA
MRTYRLIAGLALALSLAACGSSTPVQYYGLDALDAEFREDNVDAMVLGIGPLRFPDSMSRTQILTRGDNAEFHFDDFNRWAEPLDEAIYRIVTANLDSILDNVIVVSFPYNHLAELNHQLVGRIDRMVATADGDVALEVQWGIMAPDGTLLVPPPVITTKSRRPPAWFSPNSVATLHASTTRRVEGPRTRLPVVCSSRAPTRPGP